MRGDDLLLLLALGDSSDTPPPTRRVWVRESLQHRSSRGEYATLLREARQNPEEFYQAYRMTPRTQNNNWNTSPRPQGTELNYNHGNWSIESITRRSEDRMARFLPVNSVSVGIKTGPRY